VYDRDPPSKEGNGTRAYPQARRQSRLAYCLGYGEAARLVEIARFDHAFGRDAAAALGDEAEKIEREVVRRVGPGIDREVTRLAVEDALEGRRPRW
jgi:hypothetical protein